jgi:DNA-directed RNA polymerase specialized sigma24 family protein
VLHHLHGLPLEEVAEIAEIPVATVKTHLFRGRALLKEMLAPPGAGPETGLAGAGTS